MPQTKLEQGSTLKDSSGLSLLETHTITKHMQTVIIRYGRNFRRPLILYTIATLYFTTCLAMGQLIICIHPGKFSLATQRLHHSWLIHLAP